MRCNPPALPRDQRRVERGEQILNRRQPMQGPAQLHEVARTCRMQCDAREDPFDIADRGEFFAQRRCDAVGQQRFDRLVAFA
jgi:hypothetical protein